MKILVNKRSGLLFRNRKPQKIKSFLHSEGVRALFLEPEEIKGAAQEAARNGHDLIVAAGGDGTIRTVATALMGTSKKLGVLPFGTLNHFAKDLGIPTDLKDAVSVLKSGRIKSVDAGT